MSISGNGEMGYSEWRPIPCDGYRDAIKKVTLDKGIVNIVDEAFLNCANLTSIELPNNLTSMDLHAKKYILKMERKRKQVASAGYETPKVEIVEVAVEKGFSVTANVNDWSEGGNLGDYEVE